MVVCSGDDGGGAFRKSNPCAYGLTTTRQPFRAFNAKPCSDMLVKQEKMPPKHHNAAPRKAGGG